ncbi:Subtilase [Parasponia andersonii]|uniref:Subtilase n=1 Tax=Parasponia andersonii TaxID=3476 RepID=A0A2P5B248_PARAD|nr:Subtilase [Parasponia andersonii]
MELGFDELQSYIVYMGDLARASKSTSMVLESHNSLLASAIGDAKLARESKIHSYGKSFNGFAAKLLPHEVKKLSEERGVISIFPSTKRKLHTTRSWDFLGMPETTTKRNIGSESDIIVGVLDSGIWMDCPSFSDEGYGPAPAKWRGQCVKGANFTGCNNKVIGAKFYNLDDAAGEETPSPVDNDGHGTHTSSTIAGVSVKDASLYGVAKGTARGGVPSSRIAMYKVCWSVSCTDVDILAGFDDAIADGVDIISVSIGGASRDYFNDPIAIGAFHATKRGILTSCSAGNDGPDTFTVQNVAPWIMTVAATGIDRQFKTLVKLGNGKRLLGIAINTFAPKKHMYPLTDGAHSVNTSAEFYGNASACDYGTLSKDKVNGKIVYCQGNNGQDFTIGELGGVGTIMTLDGLEDTAFTPLIPGTYALPKDGKKIAEYINSTKKPMAVIQKTRTVHIAAPFVASFSSRGPQLISRNILKPDIAAPGLDILAAYSKQTTITGYPTDNRRAVFNIISGTSMACPHAVAAAAYVKSFHPDWSPAAIKSALMTTATSMKVKDKTGELGSGAGQIDPTKAVHPGLVYDLSMSSYIRFLCKEGYNGTTIALLLGGKKRYDCSNFRPAQGTDGLNYPTMHIHLKNPNSTVSAVFHRTVTHVGYQSAVYKANVVSPKGLFVKVLPGSLNFTQSRQKRSFKVAVKGSALLNGTSFLSAMLEWNDSHKHIVRSYILVYKPELVLY